MLYRPIVTLAALLVLAGCSPAAAPPLGLRESCDALGPVYVASEGAFKTVGVNEAGEELVLGFHLPGEVFGLDAIGSGRHLGIMGHKENAVPGRVCDIDEFAQHRIACA